MIDDFQKQVHNNDAERSRHISDALPVDVVPDGGGDARDGDLHHALLIDAVEELGSAGHLQDFLYDLLQVSDDLFIVQREQLTSLRRHRWGEQERNNFLGKQLDLGPKTHGLAAFHH